MDRGRPTRRRGATSAMAAVVLIVAAACGSVQPSVPPASTVQAATAPPTPTASAQGTASASAASGTPVASGASPSAPASGPAEQLGLRPDIFTAGSSPHSLTETEAAKGAVAKLVGPEGATLTSRGPDGTTYTLVIPAGDLPIATAISMTPYADVTGLPGAQPAHRLGVALRPEGLVLPSPATLTVTPAGAVPDSGIATLSTDGGGGNAGLVLHQRKGSSLVLQVPHFSGWIVTYPIDGTAVIEIMNEWTRESYDAFQSAVAAVLALQRQKEMTGIATDGTLPLDALEELANRYTRDVLEPLELLASSSCANSTQAVEAYLAYDRAMQMLGVTENEDLAKIFDRPIPDSLLETRWDVCSTEQFKRCQQTGDLPYFEAFLLGIERQHELLGAQVPAAWESVGTVLLRQCGHWVAKVDTYIEGLTGGLLRMEAVREIELHWQPGTGAFGIINSKITGEGDVKVLVLQESVAGHPIRFTAATPLIPATADITAMTFQEPPFYLPVAAPTATQLSLELNFGVARWGQISELTGYRDYRLCCDNWSAVLEGVTHGNPPDSSYVPDARNPLLGTTAWTISDGWGFDYGPFRAVITQTGTGRGVLGRIEVILRHTPDG